MMYHHHHVEGADQLITVSCLVTSGCCLPSAAYEEWYSPETLPHSGDPMAR